MVGLRNGGSSTSRICAEHPEVAGMVFYNRLTSVQPGEVLAVLEGLLADNT